MSKSQQYPDITDILAKKARGRRERASLSFAEKLAILDKLRKDVAPIVRVRAFSGKVETGFPSENATTQQNWSTFSFLRN